MTIKVETFSSGPIGTNTYLVLGEEGHAIIVDASNDVTATITAAAAAAGASVEAIVITHTHWDHIGDAAALKAATGAPLIAHPNAIEYMENPGTSQNMELAPIAPSSPDLFLDEGDVYSLGADEFQVWFLPGHDPSHIILYHAAQGIILGGDVLFPGGHGRIDIPGADAEQMNASLARLSALPDDVIVYPGHGLPTTIGAERGWLPTA